MLTPRSVFARPLRLGDVGEDVRQLQILLATAGFDPGGSDGRFGPRTREAVVGFQRSRNLDPDGVAGPITIAALAGSGDTPAGASNGQGRKGLSLHIGLNTVNNSAYGFNVPPLAGCINDANDMRNLAVGQGFQPKQLLDSAATASAVTDSIRQAAQILRAGDIFLLTYSGHGSQVPDPVEPDGLSETWVLHDRQLIDNELYELWGAFAAGVRVVVISDSCHSGTVSREIAQLTTELTQACTGTARSLRQGSSYRLTPVDAATLALSLTGPVRSVLQEANAERPGAIDTVIRSAVAGTMAEGRRSALSVVEVPRLLDVGLAAHDYQRRAHEYGQLRAFSPAMRSAPVCSVLLLSGCQDNQTSSDGRPDANGHQNGAFTKQLRALWQSATDYVALHAAILRQMPPTQSPNYYWATTPDPALAAQRPFTI